MSKIIDELKEIIKMNFSSKKELEDNKFNYSFFKKDDITIEFIFYFDEVKGNLIDVIIGCDVEKFLFNNEDFVMSKNKIIYDEIVYDKDNEENIKIEIKLPVKELNDIFMKYFLNKYIEYVDDTKLENCYEDKTYLGQYLELSKIKNISEKDIGCIIDMLSKEKFEFIEEN